MLTWTFSRYASYASTLRLLRTTQPPISCTVHHKCCLLAYANVRAMNQINGGESFTAPEAPKPLKSNQPTNQPTNLELIQLKSSMFDYRMSRTRPDMYGGRREEGVVDTGHMGEFAPWRAFSFLVARTLVQPNEKCYFLPI